MKFSQHKPNKNTVNLSIELTDKELIILDKIDRINNDHKTHKKATVTLCGITDEEKEILVKIGGIMPRLVEVKYPEKYLHYTQLGEIVSREVLFVTTYQTMEYEEVESYQQEVITGHYLSKKMAIQNDGSWIDRCHTRISDIPNFLTFTEDIDAFCEEHPDLDYLDFHISEWDDTKPPFHMSRKIPYKPMSVVRDHKLKNLLNE